MSHISESAARSQIHLKSNNVMLGTTAQHPPRPSLPPRETGVPVASAPPPKPAASTKAEAAKKPASSQATPKPSTPSTVAAASVGARDDSRISILRVLAVLGANSVAPNTVLGMDRGVAKLVSLGPAPDPKPIHVRLVPIVDNKPAASNVLDATELARMAAEKTPLGLQFVGAKMWLGSAGGKRLMYSMRPIPAQCWMALARNEAPNAFALVSHANPDGALGLDPSNAEKLATVSLATDGTDNLILVTVDSIEQQLPQPSTAASPTSAASSHKPSPTTAAPATTAAIKPTTPAARPTPATPAAKKPVLKVVGEKQAQAAILDAQLDTSALADIKAKGNHGLELSLPVAIQSGLDRFHYLSSQSLALLSTRGPSPDLEFAKLDPARQGGNVAYFEIFSLVADAADAGQPSSKLSIKHFDGKSKRAQPTVLMDARSLQYLCVRAADACFYLSDSLSSEECLWRVAKDPSAQLAVSLVHVKSNKRLVCEHQKPGTGVLAKRSPLVLRAKGDPSVQAAGSAASVFTLCPEKAGVVDMQLQARGHQTRMEKLREIATIVSPVAMTVGALAGVAGLAWQINNSKGAAGGQGDEDEAEEDAEEQAENVYRAESDKDATDDGANQHESKALVDQDAGCVDEEAGQQPQQPQLQPAAQEADDLDQLDKEVGGGLDMDGALTDQAVAGGIGDVQAQAVFAFPSSHQDAQLQAQPSQDPDADTGEAGRSMSRLDQYEHERDNDQAQMQGESGARDGGVHDNNGDADANHDAGNEADPDDLDMDDIDVEQEMGDFDAGNDLDFGGGE